MKELKEYSLSVMSMAMACALGTAIIALVTTCVALMWWMIRHIWLFINP